MKYQPHRLRQIIWGCVFIAISITSYTLHWYSNAYNVLGFFAGEETLIAAGATLLLGILALIGRVEFEIKENCFSKRHYLVGIKVSDISFSPEDIVDIRFSDVCDIYFELKDGRTIGFDNLKEKDAHELFHFLNVDL